MTQLPTPSFVLIVQLHHLQAMLHLGEMPNPATGQTNPPDLDKARHELTLLEILREKTQGNLNQEEQHIMNEAVEALEKALAEKEEKEGGA